MEIVQIGRFDYIGYYGQQHNLKFYKLFYFFHFNFLMFHFPYFVVISEIIFYQFDNKLIFIFWLKKLGLNCININANFNKNNERKQTI